MAASRAIVQAFCYVIVLSILARVDGQTIAVSPTSIAATTNEQSIVINCSVQSQGINAILWSYNPIWSQSEVTFFNSYLSNVTNDPTNFTVNQYTYFDSQNVETRAADLTINVAKHGQAATYTCELSPATNHVGTSSFFVLDPVECPLLDDVAYPAGTVVNMSCSVNVYSRDSTNRLPTIQIRRGGIEPPEAGVSTQNGTMLTHTVTKTLTVDDDSLEYICEVSFANNVPEYNDNCSIVYYVVHEVSEIYFEPPSSADNPTTVAIDDQINCTANGRPYPTIIWYDEQGGMLSEGGELMVTAEMQSRNQPVTFFCRANNSINNGVSYVTVEGNYTFLVGDAAPSVQSAGTEAWVIAVAVIVPIVVLAAIGIAIFFIMRHRKKKKAASKKTTTNGSTVHATTATTTITNSAYTPVATGEISYSSRPPPTSAPRNPTSMSSTRVPPGPDSGNGAVRGGYSPGFGDLGVQTYGGSNQAVNAYPSRNSAHGSNQALGMGGVSMNPNPGYQVRASNPVLNASVSSSARPNYPYAGSNSALNASLSMNPNPLAAPGVAYGRQPSIASSSGRSHASSYNAAIPAMEANRYPNDLSSMQGSEV